MDLFTLVAKLTLDSKEYEKAIRSAEREARGAGMNVTGTIRADDQFTNAVQEAQNAANEANLDVEGDASLNTEDYKTTASTLVSETDVNAAGEASLETEEYGKTAASASENADLDAEGKAALDTDTYKTDAEAAASSAETELDVEGTATLDEGSYVSDATDLAAEAEPELDVEGTATLDTTEYTESVGKAQELADKLGVSLNGLKIGAVIGGIGAAASYIGGKMEQTAAFADRVDKGAQKMSISTRAFQEWDHALSQSGADIGSLTRGMMNMRNAIAGEAGEDLANAFTKLGIDATQYENDAEGLLRESIMRLAAMEAGTDRDLLTTAIFGRSGTDLNALLNSGVEGIEELLSEASDFGLIMSDEDIKEGVKYGDTMANLKNAVEHIWMDFSSLLIPKVTAIADWLLDIVAYYRGNEYAEKLREAYERADKAAAYLETDEAQAAAARIQAENAEEAAKTYNFATTSMEDFIASVEAAGGTVLKSTVTDPLGRKQDQYTVNVDGVTISVQPNLPGFSLDDVVQALLSKLFTAQNLGNYTLTSKPHAKGLWDVPYDNYIASLHRDEMVLTASQAREYREGGTEDLAAAISELRNDIQNIQLVVGEKVFGQTVVDYSGRRMKGYLGRAEDRAYAGYGWG